MSDEITAKLPQPQVSASLPVSVSVSVAEGRSSTDTRQRDVTGNAGDANKSDGARVDSTDTHKQGVSSGAAAEKAPAPAAAEVSVVKTKMQGRLPALGDDGDVGVQKEYIVTRDGKADLRFAGVLLASAAPDSAPEGHWQEYRIYQTDGGKHVFSKVARSVLEKDEDSHEADVFDPSPSSMPSQLMRSARELARARPMTWMDAAVAFFGYDPLAKTLYRKLSVRFEEEVS